MLKKIIILLILSFPIIAYSQKSILGNWIMYFGNKKINNKWNWHNEIQYRNYNAIGDLEQLLLRTGFGYNVDDDGNFNILGGYGYILSQNYTDQSDKKLSINEHRVFQQFITKQIFKRLNFLHRYRFEQRWVEEDFKLRFRYFISLNIPINNNKMLDKTFYLSTYNEIFINGQDNIFDRNRLYVGLGFKLNKNIRHEIGYMNQFLNNNNRDQINLVSFINF